MKPREASKQTNNFDKKTPPAEQSTLPPCICLASLYIREVESQFFVKMWSKHSGKHPEQSPSEESGNVRQQ